ncbi:hypothetical protein KIN20_035168 [Parelaphostrongylus tenuis]|uniref:GATA-type domain-containing protein n=1 Tax=Parelaphostrongylus tenuis TaxID=148309 RepID=A0AAD5WJQ7_PARTN|nr:hypothetical protein KIN20_035168 [Parelaphostrongylus tenuis]
MEITEENDCEEIAFVSGEQDGQILMEQMPQIWMGEVSAKDMVKKCSHCGASETTCWRISSEGDIVCNACKQYRQKWGRNRPSWLFRDVPHRRGGKVKEKKVPILTEKECFNCGVKATCKWRRDGEGNRECNACNVYRRTCGKNRPLSLRDPGRLIVPSTHASFTLHK